MKKTKMNERPLMYDYLDLIYSSSITASEDPKETKEQEASPQIAKTMQLKGPAKVRSRTEL